MFTCHRNTLVLISWEEDTSCYLLAAKAPRRSGLPVTFDAPARCTCHQPIRSADTFCGNACPAASEIATTVSLPGTERLPASRQTDARGACDVNSVISVEEIFQPITSWRLASEEESECGGLIFTEDTVLQRCVSLFFKYFECFVFFTVLHEKHTDDTKHQETRAADHRSVSPDCSADLK